LGFVLRRAAFTMAGVGRNVVAEVIDAHLEMLSMIFLTTCWAVAYGWVEGVVGIGRLLSQANIPWFGHYSLYHFVLGLTVFAISFSFGFLKFTRMLFHRKRYLLFTALGNYPYALVAQDFSYFFFANPYDRLEGISWTCQGLGLGCFELKVPWTYDVPLFIPAWYFVAIAVSLTFLFLAYRSALVNLLVTRQVMKQAGFLEKVRVGDVHVFTPTQEPQAVTPKVTPEVERIVDEDREELIQKLRQRLERQGA
jgi:hypothetical protein